MKITKKEIEQILGYEISSFKVTKRAYRGTKISSVTVSVQPKEKPEQITLTVRPNLQFRFINVHIFICMIRNVKHKQGEYITVTAFFEVKEGEKVIKVPLYVQLDVTRLDSFEYQNVLKGASSVFNRGVSFNLIKSTKNEKRWWKQLFNK